MYGERPRRDRRVIFRRFASRARLVEEVLASASAHYRGGSGSISQEICRGVFLTLNDRWSVFNRRLLIASALGGVGFGGITAGVSGLKSEADVVNALGIKTPWRDDWAWHVPTTFLGAARRLRVSNLSILNGSIGTTPNPSDEVRYIRNFFAHRNPDTYQRAIAHTQGDRPERFCLSAVDRGELVAIIWVRQLVAIARTACE